MKRLAILTAALALALGLSSCYYQDALTAQKNGGPLPWWCKSSEEIPVTTGPAVGTVDWYAGTHKTPLGWNDCVSMSALFDYGKEFAKQWPTEGAAEADGWVETTQYVPGMGTHHVRGGITPQMLADPNFNRQNPILDNAGLDNKFEPTRPEVLQFDGNGPTAKLVGFDYYVRTDTGRPPEGLPGNLDWWHHHPLICFRKSDAAMIAFNVSDATCTGQAGLNVNMSNYYMLHVWVLDDMKYIPDVFAGMIPCISGGTAIHDPNDPCHLSRTATTSAALGGAAGQRIASAPGRHSWVCDLAAI